MKKNKYEIDMCNGTIMDKLISFSIPLMLSGILQLMFNAVDIVVVGRFKRNVGDGTYGYCTCSGKRSGDGGDRSGLCQRRAGNYGDTG